MKLPVGIAIKLLQMLQGEHLRASALQHILVTKMLEDGVLQLQQTGKVKASVFIRNAASMHAYIKNHFGINDLHEYVDKFNNEGLTRADAVAISGDSKLRSIRTFKGFLINAYQPINATLHGNIFTINPAEGSFTFISDYEMFTIPPTVTVVGVENPENFRYISKQQYLFPNIQPLFVSRYPQSNDLVKWLRSIPNSYLHFGDFDFAGISIYLHQYKKHLGNKASYFLPASIGELIKTFGKRDLYNKQLILKPGEDAEPAIIQLSALLHLHKKGLEQEILIQAHEDAL